MFRIVSLAAVALAVSPAAASATIRAFRSPSGTIGCVYYRDPSTPAFVRCDVRGTGDRGWRVKNTGRARRIHATDTVLDPRAPVLAYGKSRDFGRIVCTSRRSGMTCRNRDRHGFRLSRQRQTLF